MQIIILMHSQNKKFRILLAGYTGKEVVEKVGLNLFVCVRNSV
jgi:hypothetical protein